MEKRSFRDLFFFGGYSSVWVFEWAGLLKQKYFSQTRFWPSALGCFCFWFFGVTPWFWSSNEPTFWNKSIFLRHVSGHSPLASSLTSMLLVLDLVWRCIPNTWVTQFSDHIGYTLFLNLVVFFCFCWRGWFGAALPPMAVWALCAQRCFCFNILI